MKTKKSHNLLSVRKGLKPKDEGQRNKSTNSVTSSLRAKEDRCSYSCSQEKTNLSPSTCWSVSDPFELDDTYAHWELSAIPSPPISVLKPSRNTHAEIVWSRLSIAKWPIQADTHTHTAELHSENLYCTYLSVSPHCIWLPTSSCCTCLPASLLCTCLLVSSCYICPPASPCCTCLPVSPCCTCLPGFSGLHLSQLLWAAIPTLQFLCVPLSPSFSMLLLSPSFSCCTCPIC